MTNTMRTKIMVVDDHALFRRGLVALLAQDAACVVVGEAADAREALRVALSSQPDVILLDNHMPGVSGIDIVADLRELAPHARILMLTVSEDEAHLCAALQAGAHGYLLKNIDSDMLSRAITQVLVGQAVLSPEMTSKLVTAFQSRSDAAPDLGLSAHVLPAPAIDAANHSLPDASRAQALVAARSSPASAAVETQQLSQREQEVLEHIARGASNKEIARALTIAETTVKIHVQHILRKLGLSSRVQAAVYATQRR